MECPACNTHIGLKTFCTSTKGTITCPSCKRYTNKKLSLKRKKSSLFFAFYLFSYQEYSPLR